MDMVASQQVELRKLPAMTSTATGLVVDTAPASSSSPHSSTPTVSASALYDPVKLMFDQFISGVSYKQHLADSEKLYKEARVSLQNAETALERFESACSKGFGGSNPGSTLPTSMRLKLLSIVRFKEVADRPDFYREEKEKLERAEHEASRQIYEATLSSKKKLITHLQGKINVNTFVSLRMQDFGKHLTSLADEFDKSNNGGHACFPRQKAVTHFGQELAANLTKLIMHIAEERRAEEQRKNARAAEELQAQEKVLEGAHNGQTIAAIAQRAVQKEMKAHKNEVRRQIQQTQPPRQPTSASHRAPASTPTVTGRKHPRDHDHGGNTAAAHASQAIDGQQSRDRHRSSHLIHRPATSSQFAGHIANNRRDIVHTPTNSGSGANHARPATQPPTRDSVSTHLRDHRTNPRTAPPKNGAGGDKHPRDSSRYEQPTSFSRRQKRSPARERDHDQHENGSGRSSHHEHSYQRSNRPHSRDGYNGSAPTHRSGWSN